MSDFGEDFLYVQSYNENVEYDDNDEFSPEMEIWIGVIKQAIKDTKSKDPEIAQSALDWFNGVSGEVSSVVTESYPELDLSFDSVCDMLGIDPELIRTRVLADFETGDGSDSCDDD